MMKQANRILAALVLFALCALFYGVRPSAQPTTASALDSQTQFKVPAAFRTMLQHYRRDWARLTNLEPSGLHWNQGVTIYANKDSNVYLHNHLLYQKQLADDDEDEDEDESETSFKPYSAGTIILKENYVLGDHPFAKPASVTLMIKENKGYDSTMGDWRFVQFDSSGSVVVNGNSQDPAVNMMCAFCHRSMDDRDYIFATMAPSNKDK